MRVALIALGGTIGSLAEDRTNLGGYVDDRLMVSGEGLVAAVPELERIADVELIDFRQVISVDIGPPEWAELAGVVEGLAGRTDPPDAVVITHGTATLEETAYALHLGLDTALPVVITGSQRPLNGIASDAPLNLFDAVRVAVDPGVRGNGVVVVFDRWVWSARGVTKDDTFALDTFRADPGPLARIYSDRIDWEMSPRRPSTVATPFRLTSPLPRVDVVASYAGADGAAVEGCVEAGAKGIVVAAFPPGMITAGQVAALQDAIDAGVVVAVSSRGRSGRILPMEPVRPHPHLLADDLRPHHARTLLMVAMALFGTDLAALQDCFDRY